MDYGCGVGQLARYVEPGRYVGMDIDASSIETARSEHEEYLFLTKDEFDSRANPDRFDAVVALALMEHMPDPPAWLSEIGGLLKPNGRLILTTPHPRFRKMHELGALLGLFSREAADEHEILIDGELMSKFGPLAGMVVERSQPFLMGCNQL